MCNNACISFVIEQLKNTEIRGTKILEVGSYNVNGSVSAPLKQRQPNLYVGVDMSPGPCVDILCNVYDIVDYFGKEYFDVVITTEMMEHVKNWKLAINNLKEVCKPDGHILITTRSKGFPLHNYPEDHWRFEIDDMHKIFSDCTVHSICSDWNDIGVLVHVQKDSQKQKADLTNITLYNIINNVRE